MSWKLYLLALTKKWGFLTVAKQIRMSGFLAGGALALATLGIQTGCVTGGQMLEPPPEGFVEHEEESLFDSDDSSGGSGAAVGFLIALALLAL